MDRAEAIKWFEDAVASAAKGMVNQPGIAACNMAIAALREQEQREQGCEFCRREKVLYQHTYTTKLYIDTLGQARTLVTECDPCPPYADCSAQNVPARSAFIIEYCPNCGRKLKEGVNDGH